MVSLNAAVFPQCAGAGVFVETERTPEIKDAFEMVASFYLDHKIRCLFVLCWLLSYLCEKHHREKGKEGGREEKPSNQRKERRETGGRDKGREGRGRNGGREEGREGAGRMDKGRDGGRVERRKRGREGGREGKQASQRDQMDLSAQSSRV